MEHHAATQSAAPVEDRPTWPAVWKGWRRKCPKCGNGPLLHGYLKVRDTCPVCRDELHHHRADDGPAYLTILIVGHLMAPLIIALARDADLSVSAMVAIVLPLAILLMIGLLQPAKGVIIAVQWWFGMHGFQKERPGQSPDDAEA